MSAPILSFRTESGQLVVDLPTMLETRLLVQGSSGAGKTHLLFDTLQQLNGKIQLLVIDKEGQFARLREEYDYLLIGPDGELPIDFSKGGIELLLRKVLELQVNAIWDLSDLVPEQQKQYVGRLAREAAHLPQRSGLWDTMRLLVVDEAQFFAPQHGAHKTEHALQPLIELASLGRKRGFALCMATQRVEKLDKDISDLLENRLIGRSGQSSSATIAKMLDFDKHGRRDLVALPTGSFYARGPALSIDPVLITSRKELPVRPRKRGELVPPAPTPAGLKKVVDALASFQREKEEHVHTMDELRATVAQQRHRIRELERGKPVASTPVADQKAIDRAVAAAITQTERRLNEEITGVHRERLTVERQLRTLIAGMQKRIDDGVKHIDRGLAALKNGSDKPDIAVVGAPVSKAVAAPTRRDPSPARSAERVRAPVAAATSTLPRGEHATLTAACQYPDGVTREQISILTGYKRSTRDAYIQRLRERGLIEVRGDRVFAADGAEDHLGDFEPLPTGEGLREHWLGRLPDGERAVLQALIDVYPDALSRASIDEATGYKRSTRDAYIQRLKARQLIQFDGSDLKASRILFADE